MIQDARIRRLNDAPARSGSHVLYWMQASCRSTWNHALEHAIAEANARGLPVVACFGLTAGFPEANARHYAFLLEGLRDARRGLEARGIPLVARFGEPPEVAAELARGASLAVTDRGYLRIQREWRARAAAVMECPLLQVESDVVVPVEAASSKDEYAAATLRPKLHRLLPEFLVPLRPVPLRAKPARGLPDSLDLEDTAGVLRRLGVDPTVNPAGPRGGETAAAAALERFLDRGLARYDEDRNDPGLAGQSGLSPYLHFGQLSALEVAVAVRRRGGAGAPAFLEELIVRRELAMNFTHFNPRYDRYEGLPAWCRATLEKHARDRRETRYTLRRLEASRTHDPYWNAAQDELRELGTMHGYMRMYWGKKILEWSATPAGGFRAALRLNNGYQLDGRDPNGFAGVAWCFGKHDRPWAERPIFGMVRYMNAKGLERKFDMDAYVKRVADRVRARRWPQEDR